MPNFIYLGGDAAVLLAVTVSSLRQQTNDSQAERDLNEDHWRQRLPALVAAGAFLDRG